MTYLDIIFYIFLVVVLIQITYFLVIFRRFSFSKLQKSTSKNISVSVLVSAKNEAQNLKQFIPLIAKQDYPDFEIVLINDASIDNTLEVMEEIASKYDNVKIVDVKNNEAFWANKKYALTLGIKAAKNDYLLFTDADCKPTSKYWIKEMSSQFSNEKTIVLGYGGYSKVNKSILNKLVRFETLLTAIQYFSFAKFGMPYMGVGRNLAYRKDVFYKVNGFVDHMNINSGDDDLFINSVATSNNTSICFSPYSFTRSIPKSNLHDWFKQKRRHVSTAHRYKLLHKLLLAEFYSSQILFWVLGIFLIVMKIKLVVVISLFVFIILLKYLIIGFASKKLNETDLIILIPFLELFLVFFQFSIFITNLISKPRHWK
jgi:glycosyltransferase involved in cell wall biosynthesis